MLSFHNRQEVKDIFIARVKAHQIADEIIKGQYWEDGKGCAVGCTIHGSHHAAYEIELGLPTWLARLEDNIFEGLPNSEAKEFPLQFLNAIDVGVDLESVKYKFYAFLMRENMARVSRLKISDEFKKPVLDAIQCVLNLHEKATGGEAQESVEWSAARRAAECAAWSAAECTAWSAAECAAWSADSSAASSAAWSAASAASTEAWSAASAAWSAASAASAEAWSAAECVECAESSAESSAEWSAEWSAAYKRYRDELLKLLTEAV